MTIHDLSRDFDTHFIQPHGWTWNDVDSPPGEAQRGWVPHFRSMPDDSGYCRVVSRRTFGTDIDVMGWFRVVDWMDRDDNVGVKLHTALEDNLANNTISLGKSNGTVAWYVEDREGWNTETGEEGNDHSPPQSRPFMDGLNHVGVRHRFHWQQLFTDVGVAGRLWINGRALIETEDDRPLLTGRVGWRFDGLIVDWSMMVKEY